MSNFSTSTDLSLIQDNQLVPNAEYVGLSHLNLCADWKNRAGVLAAVAQISGVAIPKTDVISAHIQRSWSLEVHGVKDEIVFPLTQKFTMQSRPEDFIIIQFTGEDRMEKANLILEKITNMRQYVPNFPSIFHLSSAMTNITSTVCPNTECATSDILPPHPDYANQIYAIIPYTSVEHRETLEIQYAIANYVSGQANPLSMAQGYLSGTHTVCLYNHAGSRDHDLGHNEDPIMALTQNFETQALMRQHAFDPDNKQSQMNSLRFKNQLGGGMGLASQSLRLRVGAFSPSNS